MFPNPPLLRKMIRRRATDSRLRLSSQELTAFVEHRAVTAEEQFEEMRAEIDEKDWREQIKMQNADPAMGAAQWMTRRENRIVEQVLAQALELPEAQESTTARPMEV